MIRFKAHFDGKNICPDEPVSLPTGVTLRVTVAELPTTKEIPAPDHQTPTQRALSPAEMFAHIETKVGLHEHPADWSAEHDHYLHGAPRRNEPTE
jgi:hypothetical protein